MDMGGSIYYRLFLGGIKLFKVLAEAPFIIIVIATCFGLILPSSRVFLNNNGCVIATTILHRGSTR
jgi:hypothetical protein